MRKKTGLEIAEELKKGWRRWEDRVNTLYAKLIRIKESGVEPFYELP